MQFDVIWENWEILASGALTMVLYSTGGFLIGLAAACCLIVARLAFGKAATIPTGVFVETVRNTPFLIQAFFLYFGLASLGVSLSPGTAAIIIVAFNSTAYCVEILRSGLLSVPKGMIEAGDSLGMNSIQLFRYVIARPALITVMPALGGQFIIIMLNTSLLSAIAIPELTYQASNLASSSFRPFELYIAIAVIYFVISLAFASLFSGMSKYLTGSWATVDLSKRGIV